MLEVSNLAFEFPEKPVFQGVELIVNPGTLLHLRGPNGAGKTTLLKLLAGILHPSAGEIRFCGKLISKDSTAFHQNLCYIGHKTGISPLLTIRENVQFELHVHPSTPPFDELINLFSLEGLEDIPCYLLSVGQRRRVGLMRLVMSNARLWLLDEPLVALDDKAIDHLMEIFDAHLSREGLIVLSSHQPIPLRHKQLEEYSL